MPTIIIQRLGVINNNTENFTNPVVIPDPKAVEFSNEITPNYIETTVFGRNEPVLTYKNTTRTIKLAFEMVGSNSLNNYINALNKLLYPSYDFDYVMVGAPLFRVKYGNLICDNQDATKGLICGLKNVVIGPKFEYGRILGAGDFGAGLGQIDATNSDTQPNVVGFKSFKVAMNIIPLHSSPVGFNEGVNFSNSQFPFGE
jgi:hypothetical protein